MAECIANRVQSQASPHDSRRDASSGSNDVAHQWKSDGRVDLTLLPSRAADRDRPPRDMSLLIVDDCILHCETLTATLVANELPAPSVARDLPSLIAALSDSSPAAVLIDFDARDSAMLLRVASDICPTTKVVVLGMSEDDEQGIVACAEAGAAGYHLRSESLDDLLTLLCRIADGGALCSSRVSAILLRRLSALAAERKPMDHGLALTGREAQILRMLEMGLSNREIAEHLCIAVHTVKSHVHSLLGKLGVNTRAEAVTRLHSFAIKEPDQRD